MQSSYQKTNLSKGSDSPTPDISRKEGGNSNKSYIMHQHGNKVHASLAGLLQGSVAETGKESTDTLKPVL